MNRNSTRAFVNQLLVSSLVLVCASGGVGLGAVWMRHQIAVTAKANKAVEDNIRKVSRNLDDVRAAVETEQSPDALLRRNFAWGLGLEQPREQTQVQRVGLDIAARLAEKRNGTLFTDNPAGDVRFALGGIR